MEKEYEMQKCAIALRSKLQEEKLKLAKTDSPKYELLKLQGEIENLVELYLCHDAIYEMELNQTDNKRTNDVNQIEKLFNIAMEQMNSGAISMEHMLKVAQKAKENLLLVYRNAKMAKYAELLLKPEQKEPKII